MNWKNRLTLFIINALVVAGAAGMFWLAWDNWQSDISIATALQPTPTPTQTDTPTPTPTPFPTQIIGGFRILPPATPTPISSPTLRPTILPTPAITSTPQQPYTHIISENEVLINVALRYRVSVQSIIDSNPGLRAEFLSVGQEITVPRPTATPPLQPVDVIVRGQPAVADPTNCALHKVIESDTLFVIAVKYDVPLDAVIKMNRLDENAFLRPGDTICIPSIFFDAKTVALDQTLLDRTSLVVTQPRLLYPADETTVDTTPVLLQWLGERDLGEAEWYMIEITHLSAADPRPYRTFTRDTSYQLLGDLESGLYRWRVSFVNLTSERPPTYQWNGPATERTFSINNQ